MAREVLVLAGGDPVDLPLPRALPPVTQVVAADGGLGLARTLDVAVDLIVGDLDSADPVALAAARDAGTRIDEHPVDKDQTDLAIALDAVARDGPARVTLVGGHGGRLDHLLANVALLAAPAYAELRITALLGPAVVTVVRDLATLTGRPGDLVSLLATHGPARGVTTSGLRFPLTGALLQAGSSRGVSNEFTGTDATVGIADGVLIAVQPGPEIDPSAHP
ncbi:MAG: thiamine diphosphokinase [Nitriliruptoraceae bacterium]